MNDNLFDICGIEDGQELSDSELRDRQRRFEKFRLKATYKAFVRHVELHSGMENPKQYMHEHYPLKYFEKLDFPEGKMSRILGNLCWNFPRGEHDER